MKIKPKKKVRDRPPGEPYDIDRHKKAMLEVLFEMIEHRDIPQEEDYVEWFRVIFTHAKKQILREELEMLMEKNLRILSALTANSADSFSQISKAISQQIAAGEENEGDE